MYSGNKYFQLQFNGTHIGDLVLNAHAESLDAHCHRHPECACDRSLRAFRGHGRLAQGRPLGLLVAWLRAAHLCSAEEHKQMKTGKFVTEDGTNPVDLQHRQRARDWIEDDVPGWLHFRASILPFKERDPRPGEDREPEGLP